MNRLPSLFFAIALLTAPQSYAYNLPEKCPSVSAIQHESIQTMHLETTGKWSSEVISNYDTQQKWHFFIYNIDAPDQFEAFKLALARMPSLSYGSGPVSILNAAWLCNYNVENASAIALYTLA